MNREEANKISEALVEAGLSHQIAFGYHDRMNPREQVRGDQVWGNVQGLAGPYCILSNEFSYATEADTSLIVEMRNALPTLLQAVRALEQIALAALEEEQP